jgi:SAM-dependent methyltransferase
MEKEIKYIHEEIAHHLGDPKIIVPLLMETIKPASVIDVGCGIGTFLNVFKEYGVQSLLGLDGAWVDKEKLSKHISLDNFKETDLEKDFSSNQKFDLAICLEVVEHLKETSADIIVKNLTELSDYIVFSAAIPGQGGQNHINEQWPNYWNNKFQRHGYVMLDAFRPIFWNNKDLARWYKQNLFLVVKKGNEGIAKEFTKLVNKDILHYAHPDYYAIRVNEVTTLNKFNKEINHQLDSIINGKAPLLLYFKLITKAFLRSLKLYNK